eukprot:GEMP01056253.1.p1 GENE.GEMP01056253.1~~GEMP01056253.1.p1  ORF type:complete len:234 (+),score=44.43 GEMP01056253.1:43-744(+)
MVTIQAPDIQTDMQQLYNWVDDIPLSRPKRNIGRDFSDGVLLAEIAHHYFPTRVEVHNYSAANSISQKEYNFRTLNQKVFKRLGFQLHPDDVRDVTRCHPGAVEKVLAMVQSQLAQCKIDEANGTLEQEPPSVRPENSQGTPLGAGSARPSVSSRGQSRTHQSAKELSAPISHRGDLDRRATVDAEVLLEKEQTIHELRETIVIMTEKIKKLEQLVRIKDSKLDALTQKLINK